MVKEHKIKPQDVEAITVYAGGKVLNLCNPIEVRHNPRIPSEAQYSLPFTVATAIVRGKPCVQHFTSEGIKDPAILNLSNKVTCQADPEFDYYFGTGKQSGRVEIKLKDGRLVSAEQKGFRYGHPQNPISKTDLVEKFRDYASHSVRPTPKARVEEAIKMLIELEEVDDIGRIITLLS